MWRVTWLAERESGEFISLRADASYCGNGVKQGNSWRLHAGYELYVIIFGAFSE